MFLQRHRTARPAREQAREAASPQSPLLRRIGVSKPMTYQVRQVDSVSTYTSTWKQKPPGQRFLMSMSHEIRTPLTGIMGSLNLLNETSLTADQQDLVRTAQACSEHLLTLINEILDHARIEEGKVSLEHAPIRLREVLEEAWEIVSYTGIDKKVELICDIPTTLLDNVIGDASRVRQILLNILGNAMKFTDKGHILMRARTKEVNGEVELCVEVEDTGIGIHPDKHEVIFNPFERDDSQAARTLGGTGLGLYLAKKMAHMMRGDIWFKSEVGKGSTFTCCLRFREAPKEKEPSAAEIASWAAGKRVLLVEPNDIQRDITETRLREWGYNVTGVRNAAEGIFQLRQQKQQLLSSPYDIVLFDASTSPPATSHSLLAMTGPCVLMGYTWYPAHNINPTLIYRILRKPISNHLLSITLAGVLICSRKAPQEPISPSNVQRPLRILLAEDNIINQQIIKRLMARCGYKDIVVANDGQAAVEAVAVQDYELILMDVMMPRMSGLDATRAIRHLIQQTHRPQPCIVALTANAFSEDKHQCIEAGMNSVLTKPIRPADLEDLVRSLALSSDNSSSVVA